MGRSPPVTVVEAGVGHGLPRDVLLRVLEILEDIRRHLEHHNDPEGIERVLEWLDRMETLIHKSAGGQD